MDYSYLPKDKLFEYSYNEAVEEQLKKDKKMYQLNCDKMTELEYNKKLTNVCLFKFGLKQYVKRNYL